MELFVPNKLKEKVIAWRVNNYPCDNPVITEILSYNFY